MKLGHIELFVADPLRSSDFYQHVLGFEVTTVRAAQFVWLRLGDVEILLRPGSPSPPPTTYTNARLGLVLYTPHLEAAVAQMRSHDVAVEQLPKQGPCYALADPDGNWFQLVNPADY
jgi:catechol 2,3-dioxygenase-like lactoylglutathione lyase family enzyme